MNDANITFRLAQAADADAVVGLVNSAYRGTYSKQGWTTEADLLDGQRADAEMITALIEPPHNQLLLMHAGAELIGSVHLACAGALGYLGMFTVEPSQQGEGLGRLFLHASEQFLQHQRGCNQLEITVISLRTELIDWYLRRGFAATGETRTFPRGDPRYGIPKRQDLVLKVFEKTLEVKPT